MMTPTVRVRWIHLNKQTKIALTSPHHVSVSESDWHQTSKPLLLPRDMKERQNTNTFDGYSRTFWWDCWASVVIQMLIIWFRTKCIFWKTFINLWSRIMLDHFISHWINHCCSLIRVWGKNITQCHLLARLSHQSLSGSVRGPASYFLDGSRIHDMGNLQGDHVIRASEREGLGQRDLFSLLLSCIR